MVSVVGESLFCVVSFGKTIRQTDSGNTERSRTEKALGDIKLFWALCFFPSLFALDFLLLGHTVSVSLLFSMYTNCTAVQKKPREKGERQTQTERKTRSLLFKAVVSYQCFSAVTVSLIGLIWYHSAFLFVKPLPILHGLHGHFSPV